MKRFRNLAYLVGLLALGTSARAAGTDPAAVYLNWSHWTESFLDPNTGLTVLNSLLVPMGGNREGMGTAYTAVSDDAGYIESNAAASSRLRFTELSFAHHDWISDVSLESVVYTMRFNELGLGVAGKFLPIRFTRYDSFGEAQSKAYITESTLVLNASYNFLSGYDFEGISAGANLKLAYRGIPEALVPELPRQSAFAAMLDLGVLTRFNFLKAYSSSDKNFSIGASLKNFGPFVLDEPLPSMLSAGVAYSLIRPVLVSADLNIPISLDPARFPRERIGFAAGLDVTIASFLSVQGGFWLRGGNPRVTLGATVEFGRASIVVNSTIDLSGLESFYDKLSVEARVNLGDRGRAVRQARIDDLFARSVKAYAGGDMAETAKLAREVLDLRPDHRHARELIVLAEESLRAQESIRAKQQEATGLLGRPGEAAGPALDQPLADEGLEN